MRLLQDATELRLMAANGLEVGRVNIPNDHVVLSDSLPVVTAVSEAFGIDLKTARYTFTVHTKGNGQRSVYSPNIGNVNGVPTLQWGMVLKPLSELPQFDVVQEGNAILAAFFLDGLDEAIEFQMRTVKDAKGTDIKAAQHKGKLADKLSELVVNTLSFSELHDVVGNDAVTYTGYTLRETQYGTVANILVPGIGMVKANSKLTQLLKGNPVVTADSPATFTLAKLPKAVNGYPVFDIFPVSFSSQSDDLSGLKVSI